MIASTPTVAPVTKPDTLPIVAILVVPLVQVPPDGLELSAEDVVVPRQTVVGPVMVDGLGMTVTCTVSVFTQPAPSVAVQ